MDRRGRSRDVRKEVTAVDRERFAPRPLKDEWETPAFEEIGVSAEVSAYVYTWDRDPD
jgi:coenzyme PQQ precursor peptide PqqA